MILPSYTNIIDKMNQKDRLSINIDYGNGMGRIDPRTGYTRRVQWNILV